MPYYQYTFTIANQESRDIAIAFLDVLGFDGFEENDVNLIAISSFEFTAAQLEKVIELCDRTYSKSIVEEINWNARWESEFRPIEVKYPNSEKVFAHVRAHFHPRPTDAGHDLIITPKMSFGTGHHATTYGMISYMSTINFENLSVVDFGTGTGVLAILAEKMGAKKVLALDNDPGCITNATENILANGCKRLELKLTDHFETLDKPEVILANINLNIIKSNLALIRDACSTDSIILLSGLLSTDEGEILEALHAHDIIEKDVINNNGWLIIAATSGREIATLIAV